MVLAAASPKICQIPEPAKIKVVPKTEKVTLDTSRTLAQIQNENIDTINPYGYNSVTHTNGFMEGRIQLRATTELDYKQAPRLPAYCLWYKRVDVELQIQPKIVIAKEVAKDKCMYKAVLTHEMKHVNADRRIVNKYAKIIGQKVFDGLKQRGFIAGPIPPENTEEVSLRMRETVNQIIELENKKMEIERAEVQQAIDNIEEYESVQAQCPKYRPPNAR